jgi:hypothetical protein
MASALGNVGLGLIFRFSKLAVAFAVELGGVVEA